jgi:protein SCO1/2
MRRSARCGAAVAAVTFALVSVTAACGSSGSSSQLAGSMRTPALHVAAIRLPDVTSSDDGTPFATRGPNDGFLLVYFGFTKCPDECPATLANLDAVVRRLPTDDRARIQIAFVTVDPTRDTPAVLRAYVAHWTTPMRVLRTEDVLVLHRSEHAFRAIASGADPKGAVTHTATTAVVDAHGTVVDEWPFGLTSQAMAHDLQILFARASRSSA